MGALPKSDMQQRPGSQTVALRVMVVDDEVLIRLLAAEILHDAGFEVVEACSGDEAVSLLAAGVAVDLIFTDVNMPGTVDGLALAAYAKAVHPTLPVILTSGGVAAHLLERAGPAAVVTKPYTELELVRAIGSVLDLRRD